MKKMFSSKLRGAAGNAHLPYAHQEAVTALAASQNNFTDDLYMILAAEGSGNLFFSPFSIMTALGMTYAGARGNTEQQMRSVMHLGEDTEATHNAFQDVVSDLMTKVADYELCTSNKIYISKAPVLSEFDEVLKKKYLSTSKTVDFGKSEEVRKEINAAVEKDTNSRIKDLIPGGILNSLTYMVLVNAIYFKGDWAIQFDKHATRKKKFWISSTETITVPMMNMTTNLRLFHFNDLEATALAMDYKGSRLTMVIVLPDQRDGLKEVEAKLTKKKFTKIDQKLKETLVEATIPRFKLEETLNLVGNLKKMGMEDLFIDGLADLTGMTGTIKGLYVSKVFHKAFLEVNEEGSEAAAATAVVVKYRSIELPTRSPVEFVADHPFLFFIKDVRSGLILFSGRLTKPL